MSVQTYKNVCVLEPHFPSGLLVRFCEKPALYYQPIILDSRKCLKYDVSLSPECISCELHPYV